MNIILTSVLLGFLFVPRVNKVEEDRFSSSSSFSRDSLYFEGRVVFSVKYVFLNIFSKDLFPSSKIIALRLVN